MGETESVCLRERQRAEAIKEVKRAKYVKIVMEYIYFFLLHASLFIRYIVLNAISSILSASAEKKINPGNG